MTTRRIFDAEPHPDERVEWLRAQVEEYLKSSSSPPKLTEAHDELFLFVRWMEKRFMPRGLFDR